MSNSCASKDTGERMKGKSSLSKILLIGPATKEGVQRCYKSTDRPTETFGQI